MAAPVARGVVDLVAVELEVVVVVELAEAAVPGVAPAVVRAEARRQSGRSHTCRG